MKICSKCKVQKDLFEFCLDKRNFSGRSEECLECHRLRSKKHYKVNKDAIKLRTNIYRKNNLLIYRKASSQWQAKHPKEHCAQSKARSQRVRRATPQWAQTGEVMKQIRDIYLGCPKGFHVDHIVPIKNSVVSGLHVPANLQYLPAKENARKHNNFKEFKNVEPM